MSDEAALKRQRLEPGSGHWNWHVPVHMSQGWRIGNLVFVGGQLSTDGRGVVIGAGDIETQTRNVFENITKVLREAGADWSHVVKLNTYYVYRGDERDAVAFWEKMTKIRMEYLVAPGPAATAVRVAGLMYPDALIEADAIAVLDH